MSSRTCVSMVLAGIAALGVHDAIAVNQIKVGLVTTLSGPAGQPGIDVRDEVNLAVKHLGGKLGGLPAQVLTADDQFSPETGKQAATRLVRRDRVDVMTGIIYSNILPAAAPVAFDAKTPYV